MITYSEILKSSIKTFHREVIAGAEQRGVGYTSLTMLEQQLQTHIHVIASIPGAVYGIAQDLQRTANRNFTPIIQERMVPAYELSNNERGML